MKTVVEILIDNSNSMGPFETQENKTEYLLPDGSTRMSLAKTILVDEILPLIDYASKVTVRLFHSVTQNNVATPKIEKIYDTAFDREILSQKIRELPDPVNTGGTPITAAVKTSIDALAKYSEDDRKIILVTDGQETDGGDYKKTAEEALKQYGIPCKIFIIGIAQSAEAEEKSKELTKTTGGSYLPLKAKVYQKESLQSLLRPLKQEVIKSSIETTTNIVKPPVVHPPVISAPQTSSATLTANAAAQQSTIVVKPNTSNPQPQHVANPPQQEIKIQEQQSTTIIDSKIIEEKTTPIEANSQENQKFKDEVFEKIEQNTTAIKLISKQLENIVDEIKELKTDKVDEVEDEEPIVSEIPELNEQVRIASESFLFEKLSAKFGSRIKWLNQAGESGNNHDFEVLDILDDSVEYFIECKGTMYEAKVFYLTKNEWHFFLENSKNYQLYLITNALKSPVLTKIDNFKDWLLRGKVVPYFSKNVRLKAERIPFAIL